MTTYIDPDGNEIEAAPAIEASNVTTCHRCMLPAECGEDWLCGDCRWQQRHDREGGPADNPYWRAVADHAKPATWPFETGGLQIGRLGYDPSTDHFDFSKPGLLRDEYVTKYAWTVTDPASVQFIAKHSGGRLVDPMAGTGYWGYLLSQLDVDTVSYDLNPGANRWHKGQNLHVHVDKEDGADSAARHSDRTLFLAWPPYNKDVGTRILNAYDGQRVIFIGESHGGCTGDDDLFNTLDAKWNEVASHLPVQWWGIHDRIEVYERDRRAIE